MSDVLPVLQALSDLASQAPKATTGVSASIWDDLLALISETVSGIVNTVINPVKTTVTNIYNSLSTSFTSVVTTIGTTLATVEGNIKKALTTEVNNIIGAVSGIGEDIKEGLTDVFEDIKEAIEGAIGWVTEKLQGIIDKIGSVATTIANSISGALTELYGDIKNAVLDVLDGIGAFLGGIVYEVKTWIGNAIDAVKNWLATAITNVRDWVTDAYNAVKEFIGNLIEALKDKYEQVKKTLEDIFEELVTIVRLIVEKIQVWWTGLKQQVAEWLRVNVMPKLQDAIEGATKLLDLGKDVWGLISAGDYQGAFDMIDGFAKGLGIPAPIKTIHAILSMISYFWESIKLQFVPLEVAASKRANIALGLDPISIDVAAQGVYREIMTENAYLYNASLGGITKDRAKIALQAGRPLPTPGAIQEGFLRGEIDENEHDRLLASYGFSEDNIQLFKALYALIPPPTDLIRMAVRETFTPEIAEKFGQYEDFPEVFSVWAEKQGITSEWAKRYWASHWDLPSPTMGFEMLHRRIIDADELKLLLRALDVMPYWRERLIELSYNPITRVDLRRMYKMGVLSEDEVYKGYLDIGYSPENAQRLTEFTKRYSAPEDTSQLDTFRELARNTYSQAYRKKIIAREEYASYLESMGYHPDDITLLIQIDDYALLDKDKLFDLSDYKKDMLKLALSAYDRGLIHDTDIREILGDLNYEEGEITLELSILEYNRQLKLRDLLIDKLHEQYVNYIIDDTELHTILDMYNYSSEEIAKLSEEWEIEKSYRTKRPTLTDLRRFYTQGLLSLEQFLNELRGLGYHEKYINLYQQSLSSGA